jgi:hypothetical protein
MGRRRLPLGVRRSAKLLPLALALHVAEEAPGFTDWARRHASERYSQRDFLAINAAGLALTGGASWLLLRRPRQVYSVGQE